MPRSVRFALKAATDDIHGELDDLLSRLDLTDPADYARFLMFHGRTVPPLEDALAAGGLGDLVPEWLGARRGRALRADLGALGLAPPVAAEPPPIVGTAQLLGAGYVLEGSRLGAKVLQKRVGAGLPNSFLSGSGTAGPWPALTSVIERLLDSDVLVDDAKTAARRSFAWFLSVAHEAGIG